MLDLLTILFILLALLGAWLFRRGWTGRRVDNHPWCRACRFDLRGRWPGAEKCPECGAVLEEAGAVEIGRRRRRPASVALGMLLLIGCAIWIGANVWKTAPPIDWMAHKPDWWVERDAKSADAQRAEAALKELNARIERDAISDARLAELVAYGLELQADESATWREGWGDLVQTAWIKGSLAQEQILQYAQRAVDIQMETESPMVRRWELTRAGPRPTLLRAGSGELSLRLQPVSAALDGIELDIHPDEAASYDPLRGRMGMLLAKQFAVFAEPGERELQITWRATLWPHKTPAPPATWDVPLTATLTVVPPAPDAPELVIDDEVTAALRACIDVQAIGLRIPPEAPGGWGDRPRIIVMMVVREPPVYANLQIEMGYAPFHGLNKSQMQLTVVRGVSYRSRRSVPVDSGREPDQIRVEMRPGTATTAGLIGSSRRSGPFWFGKTIIFEDIPVLWYDTADDPSMPEELREQVKRLDGAEPLPGTFNRGTIRRGPSDKP